MPSRPNRGEKPRMIIRGKRLSPFFGLGCRDYPDNGLLFNEKHGTSRPPSPQSATKQGQDSCLSGGTRILERGKWKILNNSKHRRPRTGIRHRLIAESTNLLASQRQEGEAPGRRGLTQHARIVAATKANGVEPDRERGTAWSTVASAMRAANGSFRRSRGRHKRVF